jgi:integrase
MRFTDRGIQALKPRDKRYIEWKDGGEGLGIRVSPGGKKTWVFMYRFGGRPRMMTIGCYPQTTLATANEEHGKAQKQLEKGNDPGEDRVQANQEARDAATVRELVEEYLHKWARPRKRSWQEDERILYKDVIPLWSRRKARDITRRDVIRLLDTIVDRGSPIAANRTLAAVRKMFNFAISRDIVSTSPCTAIHAPATENRRDRILAEDEIRTLWTILDKEGEEDHLDISRPLRLALKLQLLTAQRKGEVTAAEWSEFDLDNANWTIPAGHSKNKLPHRVPLSPQAMELLTELKGKTGHSPWLFPSPRGKRPIDADSLSRAIRRNDRALELDHFTPHDLRRTAASQMAAMGVSRLVVAKVLNHTESGITAVYDRHSYDQEKRQALDAWGRKLESIVTGRTPIGIGLLKRQA